LFLGKNFDIVLSIGVFYPVRAFCISMANWALP